MDSRQKGALPRLGCPDVRRSRRRTIRQAMLNEGSGVPLVNNAANLTHFFSPDSVSTDGIVNDLRGDIVYDARGMTGYNSIRREGNFLIANTTGTGATATGTLTQFAAADDGLIVFSGQSPNTSGEFSTNDLRVRLGGGTTGEASIRSRSLPLVAAGDTVDDGVQGNLDILRTPHNNDEDIFLISALDRGSNLWHTIIYDDTGEISNNTGDISLYSSFDLNLNNANTDAIALHGRIYGLGVWKFPSGTLPADWYSVAVVMADAWRNGSHTFWPGWGKA